MSKIRFEYRSDIPNKDGRCPVRLIYQMESTRKYFPLKENLYSPNWDIKKQAAVYVDKKTAKNLLPNVEFNLLPSVKEVGAINTRLQVIKKEVTDIEYRFTLNRIIYSPQMVIDELKKSRSSLTKKDEPTDEVFKYIDSYIENNKGSVQHGSLSVYKSLKNHLVNFQKLKGAKVRFSSIDKKFFEEFQKYLLHLETKKIPEGLCNTTIAKQLSTLKTFLNKTGDYGIKITDEYKNFKIKREKLGVITLTQTELNALVDYDFSASKALDQARDVFCFSCFTGLRYSDLSQLKREHIKGNHIRLTVIKTKKTDHFIPIVPGAKLILEKYINNHKPLPVISNAKLNLHIKTICEKAGIIDPYPVTRFRGISQKEKVYSKHELISIHCARRTFCTLSLERGMSAEEVMQISGHSDYKSFKRYVNITEKRATDAMLKAWGNLSKTKLIAV